MRGGQGGSRSFNDDCSGPSPLPPSLPPRRSIAIRLLRDEGSNGRRDDRGGPSRGVRRDGQDDFAAKSKKGSEAGASPPPPRPRLVFIDRRSSSDSARKASISARSPSAAESMPPPSPSRSRSSVRAPVPPPPRRGRDNSVLPFPPKVAAGGLSAEGRSMGDGSLVKLRVRWDDAVSGDDDESSVTFLESRKEYAGRRNRNGADEETPAETAKSKKEKEGRGRHARAHTMQYAADFHEHGASGEPEARAGGGGARRTTRLSCSRDNTVIVRFSLFMGAASFLLLCIWAYAHISHKRMTNVFSTEGKDDGHGNGNSTDLTRGEWHDVFSWMDDVARPKDVSSNALSEDAINPNRITNYTITSLVTASEDDLATAEKGKSYGILFDVETTPGSSSPPSLSPVTVVGMDLYLVDDKALPLHYEIWTKAGSWQKGILFPSAEPSHYLSGFRRVSKGTIGRNGGAAPGAEGDFSIVSLLEFQDVMLPRGGGRQAFYVTLSDDILLFESYDGRGEDVVVVVGRREMGNAKQASNGELRVYYGAAVRTYPLELADRTSDFWYNAGFVGRIWMK